MRPYGFAAVFLSLAALAVSGSDRRIIELAPGTVEVHAEIPIGADTEVHGAPAGTVMHLAADFRGRAVFVVTGSGAVLRDFTIDGNRDALEVRAGLPGSNIPFAGYTRNNGILAVGADRLIISGVHFRHMAGFAVLASRCQFVNLDQLEVTDSGSRNAAGRNNSTGGILLEEGTSDFHVGRSVLRNILGNGIWTHSLYTSPRNLRGRISSNRFEQIGRDAIQVGHAVDVRVENNSGNRIGYPADAVDVEGGGVPVAIDTAGNVENSAYVQNRFEEIDGKCIDLDGFHDGEVRANTCINRGAPSQYPFPNLGIVMNNSNPDMSSRNIRVLDNVIERPMLGGIFVIGSGNRIAGNHLLDVNASHCDACIFLAGEPDMLRSGVYLGKGGTRPDPARSNIVEDNEITGYKMASRCVALAPGIGKEANTIRNNRCRDR
jgi:hypothetical protein